MSICINLMVNISKVNPEKWEKLYFKTLSILENFPIPLMSFHLEKIQDYNRYSYTNILVQNKDTPNEYWDVTGDFTSNKNGENFNLYRHLSHYKKRKKIELNDEDILWSEETSHKWYNIFGEKTQGYPYHLAILCVGILLESELKGVAYVTGDINKSDTLKIMPYLQKFTDLPLKLPVCLDAGKLWGLLEKEYHDTELVSERFETLFRGSSEEALEVEFKNLDYDSFLQKYTQKIAFYDTLYHSDTLCILFHMLKSKKNGKDFLDIVQIANTFRKNGMKPFDMESLIEVLAHLYLTISLSKKEPKFLLLNPAGRYVEISDIFSNSNMNLMGSPKFTLVDLVKSELIELFSKQTSITSEEIEIIIESREKACHEQVGEIQNFFNSFSKKMESKIPDDVKHKISADEAIFYEEAYVQKQNFRGNEIETARELGKLLKGIESIKKNEFRAFPKERLLREIYKYSYKNSLCLHHTAWTAIDEETDLNKLIYIYLLVSIKENKNKFCDSRIHILNNPHLWDYLVG